MFRLFFICVLNVLLRTEQLPGNWAIPATYNGTIIRGFAIPIPDKSCYDVTDTSFDDVVTTKDVTAKRPANGINAVTKRKNHADRSAVKKYDDKAKRHVWNIPWSKKETSNTSSSSSGSGSGSSSSSSSARPSTVTLSKTNWRPRLKSGRAALAMEALAVSGENPTADDGNGGHAAVTTCAVTVTRVEQQTVNRSRTLPRETSAQQTTPPHTDHSARTPPVPTTNGRPLSECDGAAMVTAALAGPGEDPTGRRGNGGHAAGTTGAVTVTRVEQQTVNRSRTLPCKTFTQQTVPHIDHSGRAPVPKSSTHWGCLPSHRTHAPRWMTTDHHIPITLPTCRPFTNVYNPATRWFLKMTTTVNRWSRKSKVTKSHSPR